MKTRYKVMSQAIGVVHNTKIIRFFLYFFNLLTRHLLKNISKKVTSRDLLFSYNALHTGTQSGYPFYSLSRLMKVCAQAQ